jgi:hypothetical protein
MADGKWGKGNSTTAVNSSDKKFNEPWSRPIFDPRWEDHGSLEWNSFSFSNVFS